MDQSGRIKRIGTMIGFDPDNYRTDFVERRIIAASRAAGKFDIDDYMELLKRDPAERRKLLERMTVNMTSFFRDREVFDHIGEKIIPALKGSKVRVWSAGCSDGRETYSLASLFTGSGYDLVITGTDIDEDKLDMAREGIYHYDSNERLLKDSSLCAGWADRRGSSLVIREKMRRSVEFKKHDIVSDEPLGGTHLIMCRNVLIFMPEKVLKKVIRKLSSALTEGGYLILGRSESIINEESYDLRMVDLSSRVYRKI